MVEEAGIHRQEIGWLLEQFPLRFDLKRLRVHYGEEADRMVEAFHEQTQEKHLPLLACPGVATRWEAFLQWLGNCFVPLSTEQVLETFASDTGYSRKREGAAHLAAP